MAVNAELLDVQAANIEARAILKRDAAKRCAEYCGASSVTAFEAAVVEYDHAMREIEAKGFCLACGTPLVGESICVRCQRDNS